MLFTILTTSVSAFASGSPVCVYNHKGKGAHGKLESKNPGYDIKLDKKGDFWEIGFGGKSYNGILIYFTEGKDKNSKKIGEMFDGYIGKLL